MKRLNLYAIVAGAAADMFGTLMVTIAIGTVAIGNLRGQGVPDDEIAIRLSQNLSVLAWSVALGLVASVAGGVVAARVAQFRELTHGASAGAVGLVFSTISAVMSPSNVPTWYVITGYGLVVPAAALGGWIGKLWNDRAGRRDPQA